MRTNLSLPILGGAALGEQVLGSLFLECLYSLAFALLFWAKQSCGGCSPPSARISIATCSCSFSCLHWAAAGTVSHRYLKSVAALQLEQKAAWRINTSDSTFLFSCCSCNLTGSCVDVPLLGTGWLLKPKYLLLPFLAGLCVAWHFCLSRVWRKAQNCSR